jgi:hypothetical protein
MTEKKSLFDQMIDRAIVALAYGIGASILGAFVSAPGALPFILGAIYGWGSATYNVNRGKSPFGGKPLK